MPIAKLTKRAVDALVPPKAKQVILWDTEVKGFGLRIMASGIKTFVVQYRNAEGVKAMAYAEAGGENPVALGVLRTLLLTGYRRQEGQAMRRSWLHADRGYVVFPDTKGGAQIRAIGPAAVRVLEAQAEIAGNPHLFPSAVGEGPYTAVTDCLIPVFPSPWMITLRRPSGWLM